MTTPEQSLEWDARDVMEQIQMAESRHMQMGALVSYQLQYPDMTIREFHLYLGCYFGALLR